MPKCPFKMITGFSCPGCGIQRALYAIMHGNIKEAIVRYVLPEYRFSAYDFAKIYIQSSGAEITEDPKQADSTFEYADYMKINPI
jgi:hypothetical protein